MSRLDRVIFDPDSVPPSTPGMNAPTVVGQDRIDFSWSTATDTGGSGLGGYELELDGAGSPIVLGIQTSYSYTGLGTGSSHTARVRAFDGNSNRSTYSNLVSATTQGVGLAWQTIAQQELTIGVPYTQDLGALCTGEVAIQQLSGSLPTGLNYNETTKIVSGTPTIAQLVSATFRATDSTAQSDWQTRIGGAGVVWHHNFDSAAEVDNFRFQVGTGTIKNLASSDGQCRWNGSDGFAGGGCLEINIPAGGPILGQWFRPASPLQAGANANGRSTADPGANGTITPKAYNALDVNQYAWTQGRYSHPDYADANTDGYDFYIQSRVKMGGNRANPSNPPGKLIYIDVPNGGDQELIIRSLSSPMYDMYTNFGSRNNSYLTGTQGNTPAGALQPGSEFGGLWNWAYDEWITFLWHIVPGRRGNASGSDNVTYGNPSTANTTIEVYVARAGATSYTRIWNKTDYVWAYDVLGNCFNMIKCSGYMNNVGAVAGWTQRFTQIIFSKNTIPCPQA